MTKFLAAVLVLLAVSAAEAQVVIQWSPTGPQPAAKSLSVTIAKGESIAVIVSPYSQPPPVQGEPLNPLRYRSAMRIYCYQNLNGCAPVTGGPLR